jgi:hypothetical protein
MTTIFRATADASSIYRERTGVDLVRVYSSSDTGNLAAAIKNSTFPLLPSEPDKPAELPQVHAPRTPRST